MKVLSQSLTTMSKVVAFNAVDGVDSESELSGKLGGTFNVTQKLGVYGEVSTITNDEITNYGQR